MQSCSGLPAMDTCGCSQMVVDIHADDGILRHPCTEAASVSEWHIKTEGRVVLVLRLSKALQFHCGTPVCMLAWAHCSMCAGNRLANYSIDTRT
jgi:hypothetical protein